MSDEYLYYPCISIYDLHNSIIQVDGNQIESFWFIDKNLDNKVSIKISSDSFYLFDFSEAEAFKLSKDEKDDIYFQFKHNQRIEILHAFLGCLRSSEQKNLKVIRHDNMELIDDYINCCPTTMCISDLLKEPNLFSSKGYKDLCQKKYYEIGNSIRNKEKNTDYVVIYNAAIDELSKLFAQTDKTVYAVALLYRAAVSYNRIDYFQYATLIRSVCEWMAIENHLSNNEDPRNGNVKKECIKRLLGAHNLSDNFKYLDKINHIRNDSLHSLKFPKYPEFKEYKGDKIVNPLTQSFTVIQKIFNNLHKTNLSIPLGHSIGFILET